jgi:hypothetical protein
VTPMPETFVELHRQLGEVPLDRIRMDPLPGTATEHDVVTAYDNIQKRLCELVDGVLIERAVGIYESVHATHVMCALYEYVEKEDLGVVLGAGMGYRLKPGLVRMPSVTYVPWKWFPNERLPDEELSTIAPPSLWSTFGWETLKPRRLGR